MNKSFLAVECNSIIMRYNYYVDLQVKYIVNCYGVKVELTEMA